MSSNYAFRRGFSSEVEERRRRKHATVVALLFLALAGSASSAQQISTDEQIRAATIQIQRKEFGTAEDLLRKVLTEDSRSAVAHNLLGVCQANTSQYQAAQKSFERAVELEPKFALAHVNLGKLLLGLHKDAAAMKEFQEAIAVDPAIFTHNPTSYVDFNIFGLCLMEDGKYAQARRAFQRSVYLNPQFVPARSNLGNLLVALKQDDAALKEFLFASTLDPNDFVALKNIGLIYGRKERFALASKYLSQAHELAPKDNIVAVALIGSEISVGENEKARALVAELTRSNQLDSSAREKLALLWLSSDEPENAVDIVREYPDLSTSCYKMGYQEAEAKFESGRYEGARKILEAIRTLQPPDGAFHQLLGSIYYFIDDPKKASDELQEAVRLEPTNPEPYFRLGMVFLKHRTPDPAILVYEAALKTCPDVPKLWLGLGLSYYIASRLKDAENALRKALALDPEYEVSYVVLGDLMEQEGRVDDALEVFHKVIEIRPNLFLPYYYYGKLETKQEHPNITDAIEKLQKAVALQPAFPEAHYELGKALAQAGETQRAVAELNKCIEIKPDLAQPYYQLGRIYSKMGDQAKAQKLFRSFEVLSKKENPEDLIPRLEVQIKKP